MLENLHIRNYALIEDVSVEFTSGFNILTGETGAGKSILVGALGLLLGSKGDVSAIRNGTDEAMVSGSIVVSDNKEVLAWLEKMGIEPDNGEILIRRTLKQTGRGSIFVQSLPVTVGDLNELTSLLFDLHSQHEHQSLLKPDNQRKLLDSYAGHEDKVYLLNGKFNALATLKKQHEAFMSDERSRERKIELLQYAVKEIDSAALKVGEEELLEAESQMIAQSEKLYSLLENIANSVQESRGGAVKNLKTALGFLRSAASIDDKLSAQAARLESAYYEIEDIADNILEYHRKLNFSPERLDECNSRLSVIRKLEKKYGLTIREVLDYAVDAGEQLAIMENGSLSLQQLKEEMAVLEAEIQKLAMEISRSRKTAADKLSTAVTEKLRPLGMMKADFKISVEMREMEDGKPACGPYGIDIVRFQIAANAGEPLKALNAVASGGELSRIMLAVKTVFAQTDPIETLVFDEVDTGVGGEVALSVAEHLKQLSESKQVLCITHLASIAAKANTHFKIEKETKDGRTYTRIRNIQDEERVREIGRMLSGDAQTEVSLQHAKQLLGVI